LECGSIFIDKAFFKWLETIVEPWDTDPEDLGTGGHMVVKPQGQVLLRRFQPIKHRFGRPTQNGGESSLTLFDNLKCRKTHFARSKVEDDVVKINKFVTSNPAPGHSESNMK
jgi:hypothetical protein